MNTEMRVSQIVGNEVQLVGDPADGELTDVLSILMNLLEAGDDKDLLIEFSANLPVEVMTAYSAFMRSLRDNGADHEDVRWASPSEDQGSRASMNAEQIGNAIVIVEEIINDKRGGDN